MNKDTRERILDAAERLIAEKGMDATSLREITTEARANLAAVNYHFRSKNDLILAVYGRRIGIVNEARMERLNSLAPDAPVEAVLEAFLLPMIEKVPRKRLIARMFIERADLLETIFDTHLQKPVDAFLSALSTRLPDVPRPVLALRVHFLIGGMLHAVTRPQLMAKLDAHPAGFATLIDQMIVFGAAGLRAPIQEAIHA